MKMLVRSVLSMELFVIGFALLLAKDLSSPTGLYVGFGILGLTILALGTLRTKLGWILGWIVQLALVGYGVFIFMMFFIGGLFLALWITAIVVGRKGEAARAARRAPEAQ
jgi:cbb3-type cytochrome oxidase subunit 3